MPVWFGDRTWCLCEALPEGARLFGMAHECVATRRGHRHRFVRLIAEEDWSGVRLRLVLACGCGQEREIYRAA